MNQRDHVAYLQCSGQYVILKLMSEVVLTAGSLLLSSEEPYLFLFLTTYHYLLIIPLIGTHLSGSLLLSSEEPFIFFIANHSSLIYLLFPTAEQWAMPLC